METQRAENPIMRRLFCEKTVIDMYLNTKAVRRVNLGKKKRTNSLPRRALEVPRFFSFSFCSALEIQGTCLRGQYKLAPPFPEDEDFRENAAEVAPSISTYHALFLPFSSLF
jgi:hypothetical protein